MKFPISLRQLLGPPHFDTPEETMKGDVLFIVSGASFIAFILTLLIPMMTSSTNMLGPLIVILVLLSCSHIPLYSRQLAAASYLVLFTLSGFVIYQLMSAPDGMHDSAIFAIPFILIISGLLLNRWQFYSFTTIIFISIATAIWMEASGIKKTRFSSSDGPFSGIDILVILLINAISVRLLAEKLIASYINAKKSEARLHHLNATKDKFFSIIAHDLKSPFNAIIGFSNLLTEQIKEKDYDGINEYAEIIQNTSVRAMSLLTNLLEWSSSQTGRMEYNPEYFELIIFINELTDLSNDSAKQKSIPLFKELPHNIIVFADKAMISTVFRNLISNAIKFSNPEGKITISAEKMTNEFRISVSDNGIGIEKNTIEKLFRIDQNNSTKGTQNELGTGLGLILCKEFIEQHGGKIWVESEVGKGSKFSFTIPVVK